MERKAVDAFLDELGALTLKHRIEIGGCGCCGSRYLFDLDDGVVASLSGEHPG